MMQLQSSLFVLISLFSVTVFGNTDHLVSKYECNLPFWNSPAESNEGIFTGDLSLDCMITDKDNSNLDVMNLYKKIIDKIQSESTVNQGPISNSSISNSSSTWDVSHQFEDEGDSIQIRELVQVSVESKDRLKYLTQSKEIEASGMASYLRSIEFSMVVTRSQDQVNVSFRNRVRVKRPWYALDLLFAPIARKTCLKKLNQVKEKFMPWIISIS